MFNSDIPCYTFFLYRYEIGLGTAPGSSQIKKFFEVATETTKVIIHNLDLTDVRKVITYH